MDMPNVPNEKNLKIPLTASSEIPPHVERAISEAYDRFEHGTATSEDQAIMFLNENVRGLADTISGMAEVQTETIEVTKMIMDALLAATKSYPQIAMIIDFEKIVKKSSRLANIKN